MKVLFVASECVPLVKTGGLADVVAALARAFGAEGLDVRVMLPGYPAVEEALEAAETIHQTDDLYGVPASVRTCKAGGLDLVVLSAPDYFGRPGNPYLGPDGRDWPDNWQRFGAFCRAASDLALGRYGGWTPDIVHVHDWQAGLVPLHLSAEVGPPTVATIHNIAFQGIFPADLVPTLGLPHDRFSPDGYEYYGQIGFLKAAIAFADRVTTVSPTYAREIMTADFGFGLEGLLRHRSKTVTGILNGVDLDVWNPATDPHIAATYSPRYMGGKAKNRAAIEERFGLEPDPDAPIFCVVSRLSEQKGIDLLFAALPRLVERGGRLAILGAGAADLEADMTYAAGAYPGRVGAVIGYDEPLAHLMQAGSDAILIPSRFEPCGLTQLYGLRYGTLPVVSRTGGLADTVVDLNVAALQTGAGTGFQFSPVTAEALGDAIERACDLYADRRAWKAAVRRAMRQPVGWDVSAARYLDLYEEITSANA